MNFLELENAGTTRNDHFRAADWLRAIKAIIKEEPAPEKILANATFQRLMDSVKLVKLAEELFNLEVKNMTDLRAEHEEGLAEGREQERADTLTVLQSMNLPQEQISEFTARIEALRK